MVTDKGLGVCGGLRVGGRTSRLEALAGPCP